MENKDLITKNMTIGEVVEKYPQVASVMQAYGLHCIGCHVNPFESIEEGALSHGMPQDIFDDMLKEVNIRAKEQSPNAEKHNGHNHVEHRESEMKNVSLTSNAVDKLYDFREKEGKSNEFGLRVSAAPGGCAGFMYRLEFDKAGSEDMEFEQSKGMKLIVNKNQLSMLKGVEIDYVDSLEGSGFKINNPNSTGSCGCGKSFH